MKLLGVGAGRKELSDLVVDGSTMAQKPSQQHGAHSTESAAWAQDKNS